MQEPSSKTALLLELMAREFMQPETGSLIGL